MTDSPEAHDAAGTGPTEVPQGGTDAPPSAAANLFDLRTIIAVLFGVYGIVLLIMGLVSTSTEDRAKTGGSNLNLDMGIGMLVVAGLFLLWVTLRPLKPPTPAQVAAARDDGPPAH
ncbi:hypothetical protein Psed_3668 [Pseudonocardia dioxanivorans CB1190]|uniref:Uncharacterized protein n=1 Tax=Pseudonocardia dioxanivorans (strain ATCC 55486 / DSM 44775 / JCM 13855 / CB1190) TaxID=675635 RepID=F4D0Y6_PSEUX|nr:DUF3784 domain-containing protein [Pseudonocardia dioxanivorans]AEA25838.1 hypothetical protein Psed_3668 [Pseudonocardia dioxanivorans CB1190]